MADSYVKEAFLMRPNLVGLGAAVAPAPLGAMAQPRAALADRASSLPGGEQLGELRRAVAARFGFDPLTPEGLLAAGLDPDRGAAAALFEGPRRGEFVTALPVAKPDLFVQTAQRLLVERAGFAAGGGQAQTVELVERRGGAGGRTVVRGRAVVARTPDPA